MNDVVNLNKFRKQHKKATAEKQATENRILFGRSKQEKKIDILANEKTSKSLRGKKLSRIDNATKNPKI